MDKQFNFKELFIQFLKNNNLYDRFNEIYTKEQHLMSLDYALDKYNNVYATQMISLITWSSTQEGFDFWKKIHYKWRNTLFEYTLPAFIYVHKKHNLYGVLIKALNNSELIRMIKCSTRLDSYPYVAFKKIISPYKLESDEFENMIREWKELFNNNDYN